MRLLDFIVIGAGPAGGAAALELSSTPGRVTVGLIGAERHAPYERPPLSKAVLQQAALREAPAWLFGGHEALVAAGVELHLGDAATHVEPAARCVTLASGERLGYGKLLFATGAAARRLSLPGAELAGVLSLRTFEDALILSAALKDGLTTRRVAVIGGGFIGLEVAATACRLGCEVTVVEAGPRLLGRVVPEGVSTAVLKKFEAEGVRVLLSRGVAALHGEGCVRRIELSDGGHLETDLVVVGIGAVPNDTIAREAGLEVGNGIVVDVEGRTSDPYCFAAGDVARRPAGLAWQPEHCCRLEAWEPALQQGRAVARSMSGRAALPIELPWVWSDMFDWNIQMLGHGELSDCSVVRPGREENAFTLFQLRGGRLVGAVTVNDGRNMALLKRAMPRAAGLDAARLADSAVPLRAALQPQLDSASA